MAARVVDVEMLEPRRLMSAVGPEFAVSSLSLSLTSAACPCVAMDKAAITSRFESVSWLDPREESHAFWE